MPVATPASRLARSGLEARPRVEGTIWQDPADWLVAGDKSLTVEFVTLDGRRTRYAALTRYDSRLKEWRGLDGYGMAVSLRPVQVTYAMALKTEPLSPAQLRRSVHAIELTVTNLVANNASKMADVWERCRAHESAIHARELARLIFGKAQRLASGAWREAVSLSGRDVSELEVMAANRMVREHMHLFRALPSAVAFLPRTAEQVAALRDARAALADDARVVRTVAALHNSLSATPFFSRLADRAAARAASATHGRPEPKPRPLTAREAALRASALSLAAAEPELRFTGTGDQAPFLVALECTADLDASPAAAQPLPELGSRVLLPLGAPRDPHTGPEAILRALGFWSAHANVHLRRAALPLSFLPSTLRDVTSSSSSSSSSSSGSAGPDVDAAQRVTIGDSAGLALAIDSADTSEVDDAIGLDPSDPDWVLVHVADVTRLASPDSALERAARHRLATVYLPETRVPMLPDGVVAQQLSLEPGKPAHALSFGFRLGPDGSLAEARVFTSLLRNLKRITYAQAEALLDGRLAPQDAGLEASELAVLSRLAAVARLRASYRASLGTSEALNLPSARVTVRNNGADISITSDNDHPAARALVAEHMIVAGEAAARFARERRLILPFRYQTAPRADATAGLTLDSVPAGLPRDFMQINYLTRASVSPEAQRHHSLGFDAYAHVTSPIRRYCDILAHFQLKAALRNARPPITSAAQLDWLLPLYDQRINAIRMLQRRSEEFWSLVFLSRQPAESQYTVTVLWPIDATRRTPAAPAEPIAAPAERRDGRSVPHEIFIEELLLRVRARLPLTAPGTRLRVRLHAIVPHTWRLKVDVVGAAAPDALAPITARLTSPVAVLEAP